MSYSADRKEYTCKCGKKMHSTMIESREEFNHRIFLHHNDCKEYGKWHNKETGVFK